MHRSLLERSQARSAEQRILLALELGGRGLLLAQANVERVKNETTDERPVDLS